MDSKVLCFEALDSFFSFFFMQKVEIMNRKYYKLKNLPKILLKFRL